MNVPPSYMINPAYYPALPVMGPNYPMSGLANTLRPLANAGQGLYPVAALPAAANAYACADPIPQPMVGLNALNPIRSQQHVPIQQAYKQQNLKSYMATQRQYWNQYGSAFPYMASSAPEPALCPPQALKY